MSNRQIAADLNVAPETINRHLGRISRHFMLLHWQLMESTEPPKEIVIDGFESFELSQYYPFHHNIAVEKGTDFMIYFTDSPLRRKGRMTAVQRKRREELERKHGTPDKKSISKDVEELLRVTLRGQTRAIVYSDDHKSYLKPIRDLDCEIIHRITPGKEHRNSGNELWEVNLCELVCRHCSANHKRETIAWSKRRQCSAERMVIFQFSRNYFKSRRSKDPKGPTPAMARGMLNSHLEIHDVFRERIFFNHVGLPDRWVEYYRKRVSTRALERERHHVLKYAF